LVCFILDAFDLVDIPCLPFTNLGHPIDILFSLLCVQPYHGPKEKINELIETINEKDDLLECQEDLLIKENKKFVKLKNVYALEIEKCENLSKELSICNDSISCLRDENVVLNAKIEELNACKPSTSTVEHVTICTRYRDVNVEAIDYHLAIIKKQNNHIAKLNAKIVEHELKK
jgi:hypothetical protein